MEDVVRELDVLLKAHSDEVQKWITSLKHIQSNIAGEYRIKTWFRSYFDKKTSSPPPIQMAYQSQLEEIPKRRRSIGVESSDQYLNEIADKIKDTESKLKNFECNVKELLTFMQGHLNVKPEPEKEHPEHSETIEAPLPVVQVYDHGDYAKDVVSSLKNTVKDQFVLEKVHRLTDIDKGKPLLIICQFTSRLQPDLKYASEEFDTLKDFQASIIVIHNVEKHALPQTSSKLQVAGEERYKNVNLIDVAFTNDSKFYQCDMNSKALKKLKDFVSGTRATPGQSV